MSLMQDNTITLIRMALDGTTLRQTAIASNIANANTQGYRSMDVNFANQLEAIWLNSHGHPEAENFKPDITFATHPVALDEQLANSVQNISHYRALIKGLNQKLAIMKLALHGNNAS